MAIVTAVLTHLDPPLVERQMAFLRALAPESRFVVCHGGKRADFGRLDDPDALFLDDPSLRGSHFEKSINQLLQAVFERYVEADSGVEFVYVIEYDHLILRGDFELTLASLAKGSPNVGLFGKWTSSRNDTNWLSAIGSRSDRALNSFIAGFSTRDDPELRFGCLGTGMLIRRQALEAFCALPDPPSRYVEMFVPTVIYHLGFDVADFDVLGDLYMTVRWRPEYEFAEVLEAKRAGRSFVHPFKQLDALDTVLQAPGPASA